MLVVAVAGSVIPRLTERIAVVRPHVEVATRQIYCTGTQVEQNPQPQQHGANHLRLPRAVGPNLVVAPAGTVREKELVVRRHPAPPLVAPDVGALEGPPVQVGERPVHLLSQLGSAAAHLGGGHELHHAGVQPDAVAELTGGVAAHHCVGPQVAGGVVHPQRPYTSTGQFVGGLILRAGAAADQEGGSTGQHVPQGRGLFLASVQHHQGVLPLGGELSIVQLQALLALVADGHLAGFARGLALLEQKAQVLAVRGGIALVDTIIHRCLSPFLLWTLTSIQNYVPLVYLANFQ